MVEKFKQPPPEKLLAVLESGARHIPIHNLEDMLDEFSYSTHSYKWELYKVGNEMHVAASIELDIQVRLITETEARTFVGACNFSLSSILPNEDWNATAKSMCIKNAATDIGEYFGRGLNLEIMPDRSGKKNKKEQNSVKTKPDLDAVERYKLALAEKDEATLAILSNLYVFETTD